MYSIMMPAEFAWTNSTEAYSELCQTSKTARFAKMPNLPIRFAKRKILDIRQGFEYYSA